MARHDIRGLKLPDGTYVLSAKDVYNINDNDMQLSQEVFGNSSFTKKMDKRVKIVEDNLEGIVTTVGDLDGNYSTISQQVNSIELEVADKASTASITVLSEEISSKVTQAQVEELITQINSANPNLVTNLSENWEQGDLDDVNGSPLVSTTKIRTKTFFNVRQGHVYISVSPLYEAKIILYTAAYTHKATYAFANEQTFLLDENCYFRVALKRLNDGTIEPASITNAELKVENSDVKTNYTPYYGDLTLAEQTEYFVLDVQSNNGWTVDEPNFSATLTAKILLFNEDVTMRFEPLQFTWIKQYPDGVKISLGNGTSKIISGSSLDKSATISCEFEIYDTIYLLTTFAGDELLTIANDTIMVIGYQ